MEKIFYPTIIKQAAFVLWLIGNTSCSFGSTFPTAKETKVTETGIHTAVANNDINAVKKYIAGKKNLNEKEAMGGSTPLITAALFGRTEIARLLIDAGAAINIKNNDGSTALHTAALFCRTEIVKMLLKKGADKSIRNNYKDTAYELVSGKYEDMKGLYEYMEKMLGPMGLKLDYAHLEKTRPVIAALLK